MSKIYCENAVYNVVDFIHRNAAAASTARYVKQSSFAPNQASACTKAAPVANACGIPTMTTRTMISLILTQRPHDDRLETCHPVTRQWTQDRPTQRVGDLVVSPVEVITERVYSVMNWIIPQMSFHQTIRVVLWLMVTKRTRSLCGLEVG